MENRKNVRELDEQSMKGIRGGIIAILKFNPQPEPPGAWVGDDFNPQPEPPGITVRKAGGQ